MCGMHMDFAYENQLARLLQLVDSCIQLVTWVKKPFRWPAMIKRTAQLQRKEEKYAFCSSIGRTSRRWMCLSSLNSKATFLLSTILLSIYFSEAFSICFILLLKQSPFFFVDLSLCYWVLVLYPFVAIELWKLVPRKHLQTALSTLYLNLSYILET